MSAQERERAEYEARDPVLSFPPEVVAARMRGEPSPLLPPGQLGLF